MSISPKELVSIISSSKYTKGAEMYIDFREENELKYLDDFVYELREDVIEDSVPVENLLANCDDSTSDGEVVVPRMVG